MKDFLLQRFLPIAIALVYLLLPFDAIPDILGPLGRGDDLIVLALLGWYLLSGRSLADFVRRRPHRGRYDGASNEHKQDSQSNASQEHADPYGVLQVDPGAPIEEIHRAYRRQVAKYHPDRVTHLGEEFKQLAHQKVVVIQDAYQQILHERGVSHETRS